MRAIFIRHGESTGNAGVASARCGVDRADGARGRNRRARLARELVASARRSSSRRPLQRTRQTAAPTIARFPGVPVETWDDRRVHLSATGALERHAPPPIADAAPRTLLDAPPTLTYCDGEGAESFARLSSGACEASAGAPRGVACRIAGLCVRAWAVHPGRPRDRRRRPIWTTERKMRAFWRDGAPPTRSPTGSG
jgi:probable phosphoglycerate mutase